MSFLGPRLIRRGRLPLFLLLNSSISFFSSLMASFFHSVFLKRKYLTFIKVFLFLCWYSVDRIELLLLPIYTTMPLGSPSSYVPDCSGACRTPISVKDLQTFRIGIIQLLALTKRAPINRIAVITQGIHRGQSNKLHTIIKAIRIKNPIVRRGLISCMITQFLLPEYNQRLLVLSIITKHNWRLSNG